MGLAIEIEYNAKAIEARSEIVCRKSRFAGALKFAGIMVG